jgi:hypothetical protein
MNKKYIALFLIFPLLLVSFSFGKVSAEAPLPEVEVKKEPVVEKKDFTVDEIKSMVDYYADKYEVSRDTMHKVVNCESSYNYKAVGDGGKSFGLSQIHSPSHPSITYKQSIDPNFALDFMASNIAKGKGKMWTCWRQLQ